MDEVSYFDAWSRWSALDDSLKHAFLWGLQIGWWGRIGKALAFLAGLVIVLDIVGPQRVAAYLGLLLSDHPRTKFPAHTGRWAALSLMVVVAEFVFLFPALGDASGWLFWALALGGVLSSVMALTLLYFLFGVLALGWLREESRVVNVVRCASLFLLAVGFHFDMLGS